MFNKSRISATVFHDNPRLTKFNYNEVDIMKTLYVLAAVEVVALVISKLAQLHDSIIYTIVGMMIVTFGYLFENLLAEKGNFPHRRKMIVAAIFAVVLLVYWLLKFI